jgi:hypothetical protein
MSLTAARIIPVPAARPAPITIENGVLEAAKWIALVIMTIDHVNTYLLHGRHAWMYQVGRLAMPLFGIVLAAHLSCPDALERNGPATRMTMRLAGFGLLAQIPFTWLRGGPWPPTLLNTMALLLLVVVFLRLRASDRLLHRVAGWGLLVIGGATVEFWWIGAAVILAVRSWLMEPTAVSALGVSLAFALLCVLTKSLVPPLALPLVYVLAHHRVSAPSLRLLFYSYYPLHFAALVVLGGSPE